MSLLWIVRALLFSMTIGRLGDHITLRYPVADHVAWVEVCVTAEGNYPKNLASDPSEHWTTTSCWEPANQTEDYRLQSGTLRVGAELEINEDSHHSFLRTGVKQVRPEESPTP